ncbi:hypothetical protein LQ368_15970 [Halobacterium noricense]|nr:MULTISPECIES: hypothetical protein [Halobacterium]MCG1004920.1 hypothetical protein [Halobacterium noricense]
MSEPGQCRVPDRERDTLEDLWTLAYFIATDTFDADIQEELTLDIQNHENVTLRPAIAQELEVTK